MSKPVIVLGAGGHSKVLQDSLRLNGVQVLGVYSHEDEQKAFDHAPESVLLVNGVGSVSTPLLRTEVFERFKEKGFSFATVIHPSAIIASDVLLGEGVQVMAGVVIQPGTRVGINSIVNTRASVDHDCEIGNHVHIAPGCTLSGGVVVGHGTHIGSGTTVVQSIKMGESCLIGAGSLVNRSIDSGTRAWGVPAKVKGL